MGHGIAGGTGLAARNEAPELIRALDRDDERCWVPLAPAPGSTDGIRCAQRRVAQRLSRGAGRAAADALPSGAGGRLYAAGRWHYRERDWEHRPGSYLLEVPGDSHTFEVIGEETVELFTVNEGASCCWTNAATSPALPMSCCAWSRLARITSVSGWAGPRSIRLSADRDRSQP